MKRFFAFTSAAVFAFTCLCGVSIQAQTDADLLRFSMLNPVANSRFNAMGGAFGALGANSAVLASNPAGMGLYTRHEISLTLGLLSENARSKYYGTDEYMDNLRVPFPQASAVFAFNGKEEGTRFQVGFAANRTKDLNSYWYTKGVNNQSSYAEYIAAIAGRDGVVSEGGNLQDMAWAFGIIDCYDETNHLYRPSFTVPGLLQKNILQEKGNITECDFSFSGSWRDKLYYGVTLGISSVDYKQTNTIQEETPDGSTEVLYPNEFSTVLFRSYNVKQDLRISGTGINLKLGLIYKPVDFMRIGLAFHTPTYYWMKEKGTVEVGTDINYSIMQKDSTFKVLDNYGYANYETEYGISTPAKGILSLGFLIKNFGAVSVEGELLDYGAMRLKGTDDIEYQNGMRTTVRDNYRLSGVVRAGTEWKVSIVSLRAGYIWQSCPYTDKKLQKNWSDHTATAGIGLTLGRWNVDFGIMANLGKRTNDFYYLVDGTGASLVQPAKINYNKYLCTLSVGVKF